MMPIVLTFAFIWPSFALKLSYHSTDEIAISEGSMAELMKCRNGGHDNATYAVGVSQNPAHMGYDFRSEKIFNETFKKGQSAFMTQLTSELLQSGGDILSFGAGDGAEALELHSRFPKARVWGYEIDKQLVAYRAPQLMRQGLHHFTGNFSSLPHGSFRFIACNFVFFCKMSQTMFEHLMGTFSKLLTNDGVLEFLTYETGASYLSTFNSSVIGQYIRKHPTMEYSFTKHKLSEFAPERTYWNMVMLRARLPHSD